MQSASATKMTVRVKKGYAILINHWDFVGITLENRDGTQADKKALRHQLRRFGFEIHRIQDATKKQLTREIKQEADKLDHTKYDCLLIAVMTHGCKGGKLYAQDSKLYSVDEDLLAPFVARGELAEIPKIFVIQACRGKERDTGHTVSPFNTFPPVSIPQSASVDQSLLQSIDVSLVTAGDDLSSQDSQEQNFSASLHPNHPNLLMAYSTTEDYVSYRNSEFGTLYVQSLCGALEDVADNGEIDVTHLFTKVHLRVTNRDAKEDLAKNAPTFKQAPSFSSSLTTKVLLKANPIAEIPTEEST